MPSWHENFKKEDKMHLSIDTREVDNGWVLEAEMPGTMTSKGEMGRWGVKEVYGSPREVRERVIGLLEELVGELRGAISEKVN